MEPPYTNPMTLQEARQRGGSASSALHQAQEVRLAGPTRWIRGEG